MSALPALMLAMFASEAGHLATLAMIVLAVVLAAGVAICALRGRRTEALRRLASNSGSSCNSVTGCCRR